MEEISVETLCRAKWPLRFVPEIKNGGARRAAAGRRGRKGGTGENKDQRKRAKQKGKKGREREREKERREEEKKRAPVTVHEKTNSVILFGRRAKLSV